MKKIFLLALTAVSLSVICFGQANDVDQFMFESEVKTYSTNDTFRITYDLDSLEILFSNFGGCGGGAVYSIICHSDSLLTRGSSPECEHILVEYSYSKEGIVEFVIDSPGIYSVIFFVKNQDKKEIGESRFKKTLSTPKFEIISKK
jgi:hypothetical protein